MKKPTTIIISALILSLAVCACTPFTTGAGLPASGASGETGEGASSAEISTSENTASEAFENPPELKRLTADSLAEEIKLKGNTGTNRAKIHYTLSGLSDAELMLTTEVVGDNSREYRLSDIRFNSLEEYSVYNDFSDIEDFRKVNMYTKSLKDPDKGLCEILNYMTSTTTLAWTVTYADDKYYSIDEHATDLATGKRISGNYVKKMSEKASEHFRKEERYDYVHAIDEASGIIEKELILLLRAMESGFADKGASLYDSTYLFVQDLELSSDSDSSKEIYDPVFSIFNSSALRLTIEKTGDNAYRLSRQAQVFEIEWI